MFLLKEESQCSMFLLKEKSFWNKENADSHERVISSAHLLPWDWKSLVIFRNLWKVFKSWNFFLPNPEQISLQELQQTEVFVSQVSSNPYCCHFFDINNRDFDVWEHLNNRLLVYLSISYKRFSLFNFFWVTCNRTGTKQDFRKSLLSKSGRKF